VELSARLTKIKRALCRGRKLATGEIERAPGVLVVATPCWLILAMPGAIISAMSRRACRGVIIRGAEVIKQLAMARTLFFDKTGTLTDGHARVVAIKTGALTLPERLLRVVDGVVLARSAMAAEPN